MSDTSSPRHTSAAPAPAYTGQDDIHIHDEKSPVSSTFEQQQQPRGTTGAVTVEGYISESQRQAQAGNYQFRWSSLWSPAVVNPINGKSHTFPIFRIWDAYSTAFWLATLGEWWRRQQREERELRHPRPLYRKLTSTTLAFALARLLRRLLRLVRRCGSHDRSHQGGPQPHRLSSSRQQHGLARWRRHRPCLLRLFRRPIRPS